MAQYVKRGDEQYYEYCIDYAGDEGLESRMGVVCATNYGQAAESIAATYGSRLIRFSELHTMEDMFPVYEFNAQGTDLEVEVDV